MNLLVLGRGKTGLLVSQVALERRHHVQSLSAAENAQAAALTPASLQNFDVVVDFTAPHAVVGNITACLHARKSIVVGTTGWYEHLPQVRNQVQQSGAALVYGANFSVGVNLFYEVVRSASAGFKRGYSGQIFERHHAHKKDAPSGTAIAIQDILQSAGAPQFEITSFREGEVVGMHELVLDSPNDTIYLCHDSKSRRGFAEGAVRAAEWLRGKKGIFDFRDIWKEV